MNIPRCFKAILTERLFSHKDDYARGAVISKDLIAYTQSGCLTVRFAPIGGEPDGRLGILKNKGSRKVSELLQVIGRNL
jgi:hypothetical protein